MARFYVPGRYWVHETPGQRLNRQLWLDLGVAYCAGKGAVHNLTRALALEHARDGIRINAVCPGEVNTPMLQSERKEPIAPELLQRLAETVPMGRLADPTLPRWCCQLHDRLAGAGGRRLCSQASNTHPTPKAVSHGVSQSRAFW